MQTTVWTFNDATPSPRFGRSAPRLIANSLITNSMIPGIILKKHSRERLRTGGQAPQLPSTARRGDPLVHPLGIIEEDAADSRGSGRQRRGQGLQNLLDPIVRSDYTLTREQEISSQQRLGGVVASTATGLKSEKQQS